MSDRFDELVDGVDDPAERERLRRVHELLLSVDPPPNRTARAGPPGRRRYRVALLAAALALTAFGLGYVAGDRGGGAEAVRVIEMSGAGASASIALLPEDEAGNWPMLVRVRGLAPSAGRLDYYELWLTSDDGAPAASCGRFLVHDGVTTVTLTVPYGLRGYDGWVVTRRGSDEPLLST